MNRERNILERNQTEILELKSTTDEMKNSPERFNSRLERQKKP